MVYLVEKTLLYYSHSSCIMWYINSRISYDFIGIVASKYIRSISHDISKESGTWSIQRYIPLIVSAFGGWTEDRIPPYNL